MKYVVWCQTQILKIIIQIFRETWDIEYLGEKPVNYHTIFNHVSRLHTNYDKKYLIVFHVST
jgi:hypothetical protein